MKTGYHTKENHKDELEVPLCYKLVYNKEIFTTFEKFGLSSKIQSLDIFRLYWNEKDTSEILQVKRKDYFFFETVV